MIKTEVQLPDDLYYKAQALAQSRKWSLADVIRRSVEQMVRLYPATKSGNDWKLPVLKPGTFSPDFDRIYCSKLSDFEELNRL